VLRHVVDHPARGAVDNHTMLAPMTIAVDGRDGSVPRSGSHTTCRSAAQTGVRTTHSPHIYHVFLAVELGQAALLFALGARVAAPAAAIVELLLLWGLARGSVVCWALLLARNRLAFFVALVLVAGGSGGVDWANCFALAIPCVVLVGLLLSCATRLHVGMAIRPGAANGSH